MTARALTFGSVAAAYERFRPGYPDELVDRVVAFAGFPVVTAFEVGAGTGKATRVFALRGIQVTATDPDAAMLDELRRHVPPDRVRTVRCTLEAAPPGRHDLVFAGASLHWTVPEGRWERVAALLEPHGVVASFGGPMMLADAGIAAAVAQARRPWVEDDGIPSPDGTPMAAALQWPGSELEASDLFEDVQQETLARRLTVSAEDFVGYLGTVSAYLVLPPEKRVAALAAIRVVLPDELDVVADVWLHLARRSRSAAC